METQTVLNSDKSGYVVHLPNNAASLPVEAFSVYVHMDLGTVTSGSQESFFI